MKEHSIGKLRGNEGPVWFPEASSGKIRYSNASTDVKRTPEELYRECRTIIADLEQLYPHLAILRLRDPQDDGPPLIGLTTPVVAEMIGVTRGWLSWLLREARIDPPRRGANNAYIWTEVDIERVLEYRRVDHRKHRSLS